MRRHILPVLAAVFLLSPFVHAAGAKAPKAIGSVTARAGSCVVIFLAEGASLKPGDVVDVHRPLLLGAIAKDGKRVEALAKWEHTGQVRVRTVRGKRFAIGFVVKEVARTGVTGQPVPNILAGDAVAAPAKP